VVSGNLQLLARDIAGNPRAEARVANALAGVARGSRLAAQLLAFGRRQALEPKVVNVTRFVQGMEDILRRAIGEGVEIETVFGGGLWNTFIDPGQIENALLNLAINARDAMVGGGRLTLSTANVSLDVPQRPEEPVAGDYIRVAVTDTGTGMTDEVLARAFEPFFTTKEVGKGSGLGLAQVFGFAKQSGGGVRIDTVAGEGTTVSVYLPRARDVAAAAAVAAIPAASAAPIAGRCILVVDDEDNVRQVTADTLRAIVRRYPQHRFVWVMGADNLAQFDRWQRWRDIARTMPIAVVARPGYDGDALAAPAMGWLRRFRRPARQARNWPEWSVPALVLLRFRPDPTSATQLRDVDPDWHLRHVEPMSPATTAI
ncbi:hypothetical protein LTR94_027516, partial [Friedmanniomyces endolithicus]